MTTVRVEQTVAWDGAVASVELPARTISVSVRPDIAQRRASGYLTMEIGLFFRPGEPRLVVGEHVLWRMPVVLFLRGHGIVGSFDEIDVDVNTGEVLPLAPGQIQEILKRANDIARHYASPAAIPG
jgi:hypothetical protein